LLFFLIWPPLAWLLVIGTLFVAYFFRDPDRVTPLREGLIIAPADGRISSVETVSPPAELGLGPEERVRISTFLSILDVHICRAPVAGRIVRSVYVPGTFFNAALDKASEENERRGLVVQRSDGSEVAAVMIAGLIARAWRADRTHPLRFARGCLSAARKACADCCWAASGCG
jgi:phosphatidylserine decarboxylase